MKEREILYKRRKPVKEEKNEKDMLCVLKSSPSWSSGSAGPGSSAMTPLIPPLYVRSPSPVRSAHLQYTPGPDLLLALHHARRKWYITALLAYLALSAAGRIGLRDDRRRERGLSELARSSGYRSWVDLFLVVGVCGMCRDRARKASIEQIGKGSASQPANLQNHS
jgi:hypothetical protein